MSLETREIKLFWRDIPGFCSDIPAIPEKFDIKKFVFNFWPLKLMVRDHHGVCKMMALTLPDVMPESA